MTIPTNTIFQLSRDDIINAALRKLGVLSEGVLANATQLNTGAQALNVIVAAYQSLGMPLWARKELAIPMVVGQQDYTLGIGEAIGIPFPLKVMQAILQIPPNYTQIDVNILSRYDFNILTLRAISGVPVNCCYQPLINSGVFSVWPTPDNSMVPGTTINIVYTAPFNYFDSATDVPDFPQEWHMALIYALAASLAPEYGVPLQDRQLITKESETALLTALSNGGEDGSMFFSVRYY